MAGSRPKSKSVFTAEERAAMKEHAKEVKAARGGGKKGDGEPEVLAKIATFAQADRELAERVHALVRKAAPELESRLWYGMPAYAKAGKVLCFFQPAGKFKTRYSTFGFSDNAALDDGKVWPVAFAVTKLTAAEERRIAALVRQAAS